MTSAAAAQAAKIDDPRQRALTYIYLAAGLAQRQPSRALGLAERAVKDINSVVRQLARAEPYRTVTLAQSLRPDEARAFAVIEAARALLADARSDAT